MKSIVRALGLFVLAAGASGCCCWDWCCNPCWPGCNPCAAPPAATPYVAPTGVLTAPYYAPVTSYLPVAPGASVAGAPLESLPTY